MVYLPLEIKGIIVGLLLSDGWMQKQNKNGDSRLALKQSLGHFDYFWSIFLNLSHYCSSYPLLVYTKINNKKYSALSLSTRSLPCFTEIYSLFYVNGKKQVPVDIYDLLSIQGLCHWICGDGSYQQGAIVLNTQSFTIQDNVRLINVLILKFNCKCSIHYQRGLPVIYISVRSVRKLIPELKRYIAPSMLYKLGIKM